LLLEQALQTCPEEVVVVDDDDAQRIRLAAVAGRWLRALCQGRSFEGKEV
jgi:hypothetical protein